MTDVTDELFAELAQTVEDEKEKESKNCTVKNSKQILARAFGLEVTYDSNISVSKDLQRRIDKLLSDFAVILRQGENNESSNNGGDWYCSSRGDDLDESGNKTTSLFASSFNKALSESAPLDDDIKDERNAGPSSWMACFNCEGTHNVSDCPEPKDEQKIRKNRVAFRQKAGGSSSRRYHAGRDDRFKEYVPGHISENLREALGLRSHEIPPWIYEMRALGYPPGYFLQLVKPVTKLVMYNEQNIESNGEQDAMELDLANFVEYPGFNVPLPKGLRDDYRYRRCAPMLPEHSKENFLSALSSVTGAKAAADGNQILERESLERDEYSYEEMEISSDDDEETRLLEEERRRILKELGEGEESPKKKPRLDSEVSTLDESSPNEIVDLASPESPSQENGEQPDCAPKGIPLTEQPKVIPLNEEQEGSPLNDELQVIPPNEDPEVIPPSEEPKVIPEREPSLPESEQHPELVPFCSTPATPGSCSMSVDPGTPVYGRFSNGSKPGLDKFATDITPFVPMEEPTTQSQRYSRLRKLFTAKR